nr:hypothetical protein [uncultured Cohaesibacter sp.]
MGGVRAMGYIWRRFGRKPAFEMPPDERSAASASFILQDKSTRAYQRSRHKRIALLAGLLFVFMAITLLTNGKMWPDIFPFDRIYAFHDDYWLPLKGRLWTAWYPWCLILWLPLWICGLYLSWAWMSGHEPSRTLQRWSILVLTGLVRLRGNGAGVPQIGLLLSVARWSRLPGFSTDYMELVVEHALDQQFDKMEAAVLSGQDVEASWLRRADRLMRARALFPAKADGLHTEANEKRAQWLKTFFDLAFLSHIDKYQDIAIADYLTEMMDALSSDERVQFLALEEFCAGRSVVSCQGVLRQTLIGLEQISTSTYANSDWAHRVQSGSLDIERVLAPCCFAFLAVADRNWSVASFAVLSGIDRAYNALRLSDDFQSEADQLAWWISRSRMQTIRLLHEKVHQRTLSQADLPLWPDGAPVYQVSVGQHVFAGEG